MQKRCPEKDKEPIENQSFIVSPCIVSSSNVCTLQECDNKLQPAKIPPSTQITNVFLVGRQNVWVIFRVFYFFICISGILF